MTLRVATVCTGIDAVRVAWEPLGCSFAWSSEIEPFPCAVLKHHYPETPNLGDMTLITKDTLDAHGRIDALVGGTPCQSFSVAGLRKGLADPRGNLALVFLRLVDQARPRWMVFENVPGLLSSDNGRCFGSFLGALGQLGYGWAYRVLDAQFFGLAQRRRRVFVVGHLGDWRRAAAVLFERSGLRGDSPPRREAGARTAGRAASGASGGGGMIGANNFGEQDTATCLTTQNQRLDGDTETFVVHSLRAEGFDASEDGTGRGTPLVPVAFTDLRGRGVDIRVNGDVAEALHCAKGISEQQNVVIPIDMRQASRGATMTNNRREDACSGGAPGTGIGEPGDPAPTVSTSHPPAIGFISTFSNQTPAEGLSPTLSSRTMAVAFQTRIARNGRGQPDEIAPTLSGADAGATSDMRPCVATGMAVRRLTPRECERLQGFPDDYTLIPFRGKPAADGPRYRALGNSMAVPVMRWIGRRILEADSA
jgi:DNA (cytosine-5)-methyltransferase 1